ncbi:hypothetical protein P2318_32350 [Myxococcaceae bacterium GXIMD 01537]
MMKHLTRGRLVIGSTALTLALCTFLFIDLYDREPVAFANGLDIPVVVTVDGGRPITVASASYESRRFSSGAHAVEVRTQDGTLLESRELYVRGGSKRALVWNVLGSAPLYAQIYSYSTRPGSGRSAPPRNSYAGVPLLDRENVDYLFTVPPRTFSENARHGTSKVQVGMASGGWRTSLSMMESQGDHAAMARLGEALLKLSPRNEEALDIALRGRLLDEGTEAVLALLDRVSKAQPDWPQVVERTVQVRLARGERESLRASLMENARQRPEGDVANVLLSRVEPPHDAIARLEKVVASHPGEPSFRAELARRRFEAGLHAQVVADFEALGDAVRSLPPSARLAYTRALVALGRAPEAVALAARWLDASEKPDWGLLILYGQLAFLVSEDTWPRGLPDYIARAEAGSENVVMRAWVNVRLGEEVQGWLAERVEESVFRSLTIEAAARRDPERAWRQCHGVSIAALERLPATTALLLAAEFERAGEPLVAGQLLRTLQLAVPLSRQELRRAVFEPGGEAALAHLDPELRAAVLLARARRLDAEGQDSSAVYAAAARDDLVHGVVSGAMRRWSRPTPGATPRETRVLRLETPGVVSDGAPR